MKTAILLVIFGFDAALAGSPVDGVSDYSEEYLLKVMEGRVKVGMLSQGMSSEEVDNLFPGRSFGFVFGVSPFPTIHYVDYGVSVHFGPQGVRSWQVAELSGETNSPRPCCKDCPPPPPESPPPPAVTRGDGGL